MYRLGVSRDFVAQHYLTAGCAGPERNRHSHHYRLEVELYGRSLGAAGYLADLDRVRAQVECIVARYRDRTLNELPEFAGLNPSLEHFARIMGERFLAQPLGGPIEGIRVVLWEDADAWASWEGAVRPAGPLAVPVAANTAADAGAAGAPGAAAPSSPGARRERTARRA